VQATGSDIYRAGDAQIETSAFTWMLCALLALPVAALLFASRLRDPVGADEGYLWYGALRVLEGQLPHRDFRSYEPGRYYWCAAFLRVFGPTLPVLRAATHAMSLIASTVALWRLRTLGAELPMLAIAALALAAWSYPQHKSFEPAWMLFAFAVFSGLAMQPGPGQALLGGAVAGAALWFGFNLMLYLGAALALVLGWLAWTTAAAMAWLPWAAAGACIGLLPFALLMLGSRGFRHAFIERRIRRVLERGTANLPLPLPWPWRPATPALHVYGRVRQRTFGLLFVALPLLPGAVLLALAAMTAGRQAAPLQGAAVAAAALGISGWHHAYSRADVSHLAQSMVPLLLLSLLAAIALPASLGLLAAALVGAASLSLMWPHLAPRPNQVRIPRGSFAHSTFTADQTALVRRVESLRGAEDGAVLAVPTLAWLYPMLGIRAPVYEIFGVWPSSDEEQARMIDEIERNDVRTVVVANSPLDRREDLRFSATHPQVWAELHRRFAPCPPDSELPDMHFFRRAD
jgi:hypothetical protein